MNKIILEHVVPQQPNHVQNCVALVVLSFDKAQMSNDLDLVVLIINDCKSDVRVIHQSF